MKALAKVISISLIVLPFTLAVQAEEKAVDVPPPPPPHEMPPGMMGMQPGMGMPMPGMHPGMGMHEEPPLDTEHLKEQQAHILLMHDLSTKILAEKDPKKQQALKDQQLEVMKAHIQAMKEKRHKMKMRHHSAPAAPPATSTQAPAQTPPAETKK